MRTDPILACGNTQQKCLWALVHDALAHPLMALTGWSAWGIRLHDYTSKKAWPIRGSDVPTVAEPPAPKISAPAEPPLQYKKELRILLRKGLSITFSQDEPTPEVVAPWKDFYAWYFGRPQSDCFRMQFSGGERMLLRWQIVTFETRATPHLKAQP